MKVVKTISNILIEQTEKGLAWRDQTIVTMQHGAYRPLGYASIYEKDGKYYCNIDFEQLQDRNEIGLLVPSICYGDGKIYSIGLVIQNTDPDIPPLKEYLQ